MVVVHTLQMSPLSRKALTHKDMLRLRVIHTISENHEKVRVNSLKSHGL
jgi:hypothetical protein